MIRWLGVGIVVVALGCQHGPIRLVPPGVVVTIPASAAALAFEQGIESALLGLPIDACPYGNPDAARAWRAGWRWARGS